MRDTLIVRIFGTSLYMVVPPRTVGFYESLVQFGRRFETRGERDEMAIIDEEEKSCSLFVSLFNLIADKTVLVLLCRLLVDFLVYRPCPIYSL